VRTWRVASLYSVQYRRTNILVKDLVETEDRNDCAGEGQ
jgi:hypothetical protein